MFRAPGRGLVGIVGILGCLYLFISLPNRTQMFFVCAQVIGLVLYVDLRQRRRGAGEAEAGGSALPEAFQLLAKLAQRHVLPLVPGADGRRASR